MKNLGFPDTPKVASGRAVSAANKTLRCGEVHVIPFLSFQLLGIFFMVHKCTLGIFNTDTVPNFIITLSRYISSFEKIVFVCLRFVVSHYLFC